MVARSAAAPAAPVEGASPSTVAGKVPAEQAGWKPARSRKSERSLALGALVRS